MALPKGLKKKLQQAIQAQQRRLARNNYFVTKEPSKLTDIPERSLVVVLTPYDDEAA